MKEFIEKLIGKLEESRKEYMDEYGIIDIQTQEVFVKIRRIINKLAEEYIPCAKSCTDCEAYDLVKHNCPKFCKVIKETIEEIKEEYNNGWIPCEVRLPEKYCHCLVTRRNDYEDGFDTDVCEDCFIEIEGIWDWQSKFEGLIDNIIAWMPLPEPYKEGSE